MTPKEKAEELIEKMHKCLFSDGRYDATQCAIIAVEEIIKHNLCLDKYIGFNQGGTSKLVSDFNYWDNVLHELKEMQ